MKQLFTKVWAGLEGTSKGSEANVFDLGPEEASRGSDYWHLEKKL